MVIVGSQVSAFFADLVGAPSQVTGLSLSHLLFHSPSGMDRLWRWNSR
jgi:hypothetical protein